MVAAKPVDFHKSHDGLVALVKNKLRTEPFTGMVFLFRAKRADQLKLLFWDTDWARFTTSATKQNT